MSTSAKKTGLLSVGIVVLILGLLAGAGLLYSATQRQSDAVRNLARAPLGCDTTLDFDGDGKFFIFIETSGTLDSDIAGDCETPISYIWTDNSPPLATLTLTSPSGDDVVLDARGGIDYDSDGYTGQSVRTFRVDDLGDHVLRVESPDGSVGFAAAVGRDPAEGVAMIRLGGLVAGFAGLILGLGLILQSRRGSEPAVDPTQATWPVAPAPWPTAPPGMPTAPAPMPGQSVPGPPSGLSPQPAPTAAPTQPASATAQGFMTPPPPPAGAAPPVPPPAPVPAAQPPPPASSWAPAPPSGPPAGPSTAPPVGPGHRSDSAWANPAQPQQNPPTGAVPGPPANGSTGDGERSPWAPPES